MKVTEIKKAGTVLLICALGMVIVQLAAPIILGIFVQGAAMAVPLGVYHFFIKEKWRLHLVKDKEHGDNPMEENSMAESGVREEKFEDCEWDGQNEYQDYRSERADETLAWYEEQGRDKIMEIIRKLSVRNIEECWIRKDGICNIRTGKGYRRTGTLPGFGGIRTEILAELLKRDGITAEMHGRYLYLTWKD